MKSTFIPGPKRRQSLRQFAGATDIRHYQIRYQQVNGIGIGVSHLQGYDAIDRNQHFVTAAPQRFPNNIANAVLIFHHQDRLGALSVRQKQPPQVWLRAGVASVPNGSRVEAARPFDAFFDPHSST